MQRHAKEPRSGWQGIVESQGMHYHTADGEPYWDESVFYEFTAREIDELEAATYALNDMCLAAVEHVIEQDRFDEFLIPKPFREFIARSWEEDEHTLVGRFDLAYDGRFPPKLLEYNADTPTALLEASVIQWFWLKDCFRENLQFNSIHERLLEVFRMLRKQIQETFFFTAVGGSLEDFMTVEYLRDVATQAGFTTAYLNIENIGWHSARQAFTDLKEHPIRCCFKLYPWEWMQREQFGPHLLKGDCRWFEPPWKALLSNKALLPVLWELNPGHPQLLETSFQPLPGGDYVKKPIHGREGANIEVYEKGRLFLQTEGPYAGPAVYQETWPLPRFEKQFFPVIGSWMVGGWACGLGIREDENLITSNLSRFVPHLYR